MSACERCGRIEPGHDLVAKDHPFARKAMLCKRPGCGMAENRKDGYCSCECERLHEVEKERDEWQARAEKAEEDTRRIQADLEDIREVVRGLDRMEIEQKNRAEKAEAEAAKYREALERIEGMPVPDIGWGDPREVARDALERKEP